MCGRYTLFYLAGEEALRELVEQAERHASEAGAPVRVRTGEIFPGDIAPVLVAGDGPPAARAMVWGYPGHAGAVGRKPKLVFNTRAETAESSPFWRDSFTGRRCLVPSTGFYEWRYGTPAAADQLSFFGDAEPAPPASPAPKRGKGQKLLFRLPGQRVLYMAGIYKTFRGEDGALRQHFSILTTQANPWMAPVHHRMPVVLRPEEWDQWLTGDYHALLDRRGIPLENEEAPPE